jgi:hypothetical protein
MIKYGLDRNRGILTVSPVEALEAGDFQAIARMVDPYITEAGALTGLLIDAPSFPGWKSFGALLEHLKFVKDHHKRIKRVAAVTDSAFLEIAPRIARHFADPEIRVFGTAQRAQALAWLETGT